LAKNEAGIEAALSVRAPSYLAKLMRFLVFEHLNLLPSLAREDAKNCFANSRHFMRQEGIFAIKPPTWLESYSLP
jgi:hypothetical protein